ncbi:MAG: hypothetical protein OXG40_14735 [Acidimicrobiaceae bacterium]|nr:hypothetical protein [Acidimicrobiaceae bacterium]MDE0517199.1 hypothetical protein [Acidimicrobiaceae bacterium]MDE0657697.1 hypothetical protein [Acidimicrobiaceae bacterium]
MIVRGWHFSFDAGGDAALATLYYPGDGGRLEEARLTGQVPAAAGEPWPLVIVMPGINVAPDSYRWLAHQLVPTGVCVVTYAAIGSLGPAGQGITPGLDLDALTPANIGTRRAATALNPLLDRLAGLSEADGAPPAGMLDLDRVVVGGHSAGGTVALHSSDPGWVPGLRAVFAYGGHTMTATSLGHGEAAVVAIPAKVPVLLLAGTDDGVISASRDRYHRDHATHDGHGDHGGDGDHDPVRRTFEEAVGRRQGDCWLVELFGAGHFAVCHPVDTTSGRAFLEPDPAGADPAARELIGDLVAAFVAASLGDPAGAGLEQLVEHDLVAHWDRR